jgi:hypothetical protein
LLASIQRGTGSVGLSPVRKVAVAADADHWSQSLGANGLWFDPDTLTSAVGTSITQWTAVNRALTLGVDRTQLGGTGTGAGMVVGTSNGHNMLLLPASNGGLWIGNSGLTSGSSWATKTFFSSFYSTDIAFGESEKRIFALSSAPGNVTNSQIASYLYGQTVGTAFMAASGLSASAPANAWMVQSQTLTPTQQLAWLNGQTLGSQALGGLEPQ